MAFISCQWPSSMIVTKVASSGHRSTSMRPSSVATEAPKATSRPIEISSIIPGCLLLISLQPLVRKTGPP
ncbi:MAG: hypothetical protein K0R11_1046 [Acidimicrobiales bacterium]|nr:hypothetical protein [Acidimicrobiales bacterium]